MEVESMLKEYNNHSCVSCKTLEDIIINIVRDILSSINYDLYKLISDIETGNYSINEIVDELDKMRKKII